MIIDERVLGTTRMIALIGNPVEHSISPIIHNTLSKNLDKNLIYAAFKVQKNRMDYVVEAFKELGVVGFNVTVPFKREIMKFIDENSREALLMGAVNTVKIIDGRLYGYNTDAEGFSRSFKEETGYGFRDKNVLLIGAGGAARAIAVKIALEGAKNINIINRTSSTAEELAELINLNIDHIVSVHNVNDLDLSLVFEESDIIINTTAVGMYPDSQGVPIANTDLIQSYHIVYDVIYNPEETKFLALAKERGAKTVNGLGMLINQAIISYEIWTGVKVPDDMARELHKNIKEKILL